MAKNLIIVESPAKTRTLKKFLGRDWAIEASVGHIRDLPKKDMGLGENYEPTYAVLATKKDVVKKLKEAAKHAEQIYLAPDPDREGEAIAWHIAEVLGNDAAALHRVTFNEITKSAVLKALEHPGDDRPAPGRRAAGAPRARPADGLQALAAALGQGQARALRRARAVGRPQDGLRAAGRDRRLRPGEYWILGARLAASAPPEFLARLHQLDGKKAGGRQRRRGRGDRERAARRRVPRRDGRDARSRSRTRRRRSSPAGCSRRRRGDSASRSSARWGSRRASTKGA